MKATGRNLAGTAVLLSVAAAAVVFAFFGVVKRDEAAHARKAAQEKLYAFAPAKVKAVVLEARGDASRLVRAGDGWRLEAPVQAEAERATVDALVDRVAELRRKAAIADAPAADALPRYGLASPRAKVTLTLDDGRVETLALGDENAFDGTAFVRTTGGAVDLVAGDVKWAVERSALDLREKRVLPLDETTLQRLEVTAPPLAYALAREGAAWRLDAPVRERADDAAVSRVLGALRGLRATAFVTSPGPDASYGLDRPRWTVRAVGAGGAARTLRLGEAPARAGDAGPRSLYARLDDARELAVVPAGSARDLEQDLDALRDKAVLHVEREQVASLRFDRGGTTFDVRRESAPTRLGAYAWTLTALRGKSLAPEGAASQALGLERPALAVTLLAADGKELDRLLVSEERGGRTYARAASSPRALEIDPASLATLPKTAEDAQEKPPSAAQAEAAPK